MNTIEESVKSCPNLESLTVDELADLASNPEMLGGVRAEVSRRLANDPRKANFLTFRYLLPADDADQYDAFVGLQRCCWRAAKARHAIDWRYARTATDILLISRHPLSGSMLS